MSNFRSRALLDLAHKLPLCMNCGHATPDGCEPAHQNGIGAGKGFGIKARDNRHAGLCHICHAWYDQGANVMDPSGMYEASKVGKAEMWIRAHLATFDFYWGMGWLSVV